MRSTALHVAQTRHHNPLNLQLSIEHMPHLGYVALFSSVIHCENDLVTGQADGGVGGAEVKAHFYLALLSISWGREWLISTSWTGLDSAYFDVKTSPGNTSLITVICQHCHVFLSLRPGYMRAWLSLTWKDCICDAKAAVCTD